MSTRIFAWMTDTAGCFLYRLFWPLTTLISPQFDPHDQFEAQWGAPGPDIGDFNVVIGQRIAGHSELWRTICADPNILAVYDLDDNLLIVDPANVPIYNIYAPLGEGTAGNIRAADVVTVSTPNLAAAISHLNPNIVVLPNCLPQAWIQPPVKLHRPQVIGWGGSFFHGDDFRGVPEALKMIFPHHNVRYQTHGANYLPGLPVQFHGWTTLEQYHQQMNFDIGIAPVRQTPFNNCKSHCKVLEYASRGIPAVATRWGQYPEFIDDGINGFLVDDPAEFTDALEAMLDPPTWSAMSAAAALRAGDYTIEGNIHKWAQVYTGGVA